MEPTGNVHQLSLGRKAVLEHPSDVVLLVLTNDTVKRCVKTLIVVVVVNAPAFGINPRRENMHVVVLRVMVEVDEIGLLAHAVLTHHGMGDADKLLFVLLLSLAGKSVQGMQEVAVDIGMAGKLGDTFQNLLLVVSRPREYSSVNGL